MKKSMQRNNEKNLQNRCSAFCHTCRLSVSSSSSTENSTDSDEIQTVSSIAHAMVQERLDQIIKRKDGARSGGKRNDETKVVVMVAMEKCSCDPREDFRESIELMIVVNGIEEAKDLRRLLNYYLLMNSEEFGGVILEVFHEVCTDLFVNSKV